MGAKYLSSFQMNEEFRQRLRTARTFCIWGILAGPVALTLMWAALEGFSAPLAKLWHLYLVLLIHCVSFIPVWGALLLAVRTRHLQLSWPAMAGGYLGVVLLGSLTATTILFALRLKPGGNWAWTLFRSIGGGLTIMPAFLLIERFYHAAVMAGADAKRREVERERAQRVAAEAQWLSLESRVRPHFLFNTLSSIRELMHRDVAEADRMIQRFAGLVRFTLDSGRNAIVTLDEELLTVAGYLEIEQMRLGPRLRWEIEADTVCRSLPVPSLSVLTLVENSIKHVVARRRGGGFVGVTAKVQGAQLHIDVRDDGPGFDDSAIVEGHGLDLLLQRLAALYRGEAALILNRAHGGGLSAVTLLTPAEARAGGQSKITTDSSFHEQAPLLSGR